MHVFHLLSGGVTVDRQLMRRLKCLFYFCAFDHYFALHRGEFLTVPKLNIFKYAGELAVKMADEGEGSVEEVNTNFIF